MAGDRRKAIKRDTAGVRAAVVLPVPPDAPAGNEAELKRQTRRYCEAAFEALWGPLDDVDRRNLDYAARLAWWKEVRGDEEKARRIAYKLDAACVEALRFAQTVPDHAGPRALGLRLAARCLRGAVRRIGSGDEHALFPGEPTLGAWLRWNQIERIYSNPVRRVLTDREVSVLVLLAGYWPPSTRRAANKSVARLLGETDKNVQAARKGPELKRPKRRGKLRV